MANDEQTTTPKRTITEQAQEALDLAKIAIERGDMVHGLAALHLGAQLAQLAKLLEPAK